MNNEVDIKTDALTEWLKKEWNYEATSIEYNRQRRVVSLSYYYMAHRERECSSVYPILNSYIYSKEPYCALEPPQMIDVYNEHGYIAAPGYMNLSIAGLEILLEDYGIKTSICKKIDVERDWWRIYNRYTYKIIPKSDTDYACLILYLSDDIVKLKDVSQYVIELHNILPKGK